MKGPSGPLDFVQWLGIWWGDGVCSIEPFFAPGRIKKHPYHAHEAPPNKNSERFSNCREQIQALKTNAFYNLKCQVETGVHRKVG